MAKLSHEEILELASSHALLASLDKAILEKVILASKLVQYRANRPVVKAGDPADYIYCLLRGAIRVYYKDESDNEVLIKLFRAPSLLCEMEVLAEIPVMPNARTLEPSDVLLTPAEVFRQLVKTQPKLTRVLITDLATRLCVSRDNQRALAFADTERRFANLLVDYAQLAGVPVERGIRINISLSQDGMARDLGVSRKAVNLALKKLKDEGIIDKEEARYVILDMKALAEKTTLYGLGITHRLGASITEAFRPK